MATFEVKTILFALSTVHGIEHAFLMYIFLITFKLEFKAHIYIIVM